MSTQPKRRRRLVEKGGVEAFESRVVQWFDSEGRSWTSVETTVPEGHTEPELVESLGALEMAKHIVVEQAAG